MTFKKEKKEKFLNDKRKKMLLWAAAIVGGLWVIGMIGGF